jgi:hypothetical protein
MTSAASVIRRRKKNKPEEENTENMTRKDEIDHKIDGS